jgi:uncharacterized membrane-anchored protein YhcB (DUF1043 family)
MFVLGLVIGLFVGANIGILIIELCNAAHRDDEYPSR